MVYTSSQFNSKQFFSGVKHGAWCALYAFTVQVKKNYLREGNFEFTISTK